VASADHDELRLFNLRKSAVAWPAASGIDVVASPDEHKEAGISHEE
jgi:hypothetical protein